MIPDTDQDGVREDGEITVQLHETDGPAHYGVTVRSGRTKILDADLTPENVRHLRGEGETPVATSARVFELIEDALSDFNLTFNDNHQIVSGENK